MKDTATVCTAINVTGNHGLKPGKMYDMQITIDVTIDVQLTKPLIMIKYSSLAGFLKHWECLTLTVPADNAGL